MSENVLNYFHIKCIFRNPKECKERHKVVMDSPGGEGADSADDSGSSRPYRSTLPGIPKAIFSIKYFIGSLKLFDLDVGSNW